MKFKTVIILVISMLLTTTLTSKFNIHPANAEDWWLMFHYDPSHAGYSSSIAPDINSTVWVTTVGSSNNGIHFSSPAVADGMVFIGSCYDSKIYAFNESTGSIIWSYRTGGNVTSSPAVVNGKVFVGSLDGKVYAFGSPPVGGIQIPINKLVLLAPCIALTAIVVAVVAGSAYAGKRWLKKQLLNNCHKPTFSFFC